MKKIEDMTPEELAAYVCSHLESHGISVVLSGGSCVSFYTKNKYQSYDFDFIPQDLFLKRTRLKEVLALIGFTEKHRYFQNEATAYLLEFPPGPLTVGDEPVKEISKRELETGTLRLISATDSIKDRLAGYYHWKDRQCLEQAILIAQDNAIELSEIERWSAAEGMSNQFEIIMHRFTKEESKDHE